MSVTSVDRELLHRVILYITYSQYTKKLSMIVTNVIIELFIWVMLHFTSVYEGVKYECNECEYRAATEGNLICYIQSVHEEDKYDCHYC